MRSLNLVKNIQPPVKEKAEPKTKKKIDIPADTPLAESLLDALNESIGNDIEGRFKKRKGFVPSETNQCIRYLTYMLEGIFVPATHDSRTQRIFDNGNGFHERIAGYFEKMGILECTEFEVNSPISVPVSVYGFGDAIINWNGRKVVEFKSINDYGYINVKRMRKPKDDHFRQIQLYLACLDMDSGFVIYENKNDQNILVFEIQRDDAFLAKLYKKYVKVTETYEAGILPDRPYVKSSKSCLYCNVKDFCWSEEGNITLSTKKD